MKAGESPKPLNNWIEVSEARLAANFHTLQAAGPETTVLAVIKANAYGHGAETCAPMLARAGATWLGVTSATEGAKVRRALAGAGVSPQPDILIMCGFLAEDVPALLEHGLTPVVWTAEQVSWLARCPESRGMRVHVEVDTGMGRQGVSSGPDFDTFLAHLEAFQLVCDGIFTHFCSSETAGSPVTARQQQRFEAVVLRLRNLGIKPTWLHAGNSSAVDNPAPDRDWLPELAASIGARPLVRTGLALYGYCLPIENATTAAPSLVRQALKPVLAWKARVLSVRALAPGDTVGYNATYTASHPMRVALLPVGYADGLRRELSSTNQPLNIKPGGWVTIHDYPAPILGRISMNLTVVDVTHIPDARAGDEAVILGDTINADDHAALAHTIAYEILCGIHPCP